MLCYAWQKDQSFQSVQERWKQEINAENSQRKIIRWILYSTNRYMIEIYRQNKITLPLAASSRQ